MEEWEKELARELEGLPELEAPATLIPRVMTRLHDPAPAVWAKSPWWQWPLAARLASILAVSAVLVALAWLSESFGPLHLWHQITLAWTGMQETFSVVFDAVATAMGAGSIWWGNYGQTVLLGVAALLLVTYLTCVAAGTALYQLAWKRAQQ
jgi:hypothetical protein